MEKVLLAIDGGGTKTKGVIFSKEGKILNTILTGVGSFAVSKDKAFQNIDEIIDKMLTFCFQKYEITMIQMGISGLGAILDVSSLEKRYYNKYQIKISIDNDVFLALYSVIRDKYNEGIVVVSGTGSGIGGINNGKRMLVGGWGHLLDEYGSAYSLVKDAILLVKDEYELKGTISSFGEKLLSLLKLENVYQFKAFMYSKTKYEVASFAKDISQLAFDNDDVAIKLFEKSAGDLEAAINRLKIHLNLPSNAILGFRGAFIHHAYNVQEKLKSSLVEKGVINQFDSDNLDPIYGAYYMRKGEF